MHALALLIDEVKAAQDLSDEDIARIATRGGFAISKQHIAHLRKQDPLKSIVPDTMRALAVGMGVPLARVVAAALPSAGLPSGLPEDWSVEAAIDHDPELTVQSKRMLHTLLASARGEQSVKRSRVVPMKPARQQLARPDSAGRAARRRNEENPEQN